MYQKFWNQFLTEAVEPTFNLDNDEPTKPDPQPVASQEKPETSEPEKTPDIPSATGVGAYLISKGFYPDKELGRGVDGVVVGATNKKTGQKVAVKFVRQTTEGDMRREAKNYETIKNKRNSLGEFAKHFPVVYSSSIEEVPLDGEPIDGQKIPTAVIIMEQLEELPKEVAVGLFPTGDLGRKNAKAIQKRDKRIFKNDKLVGGMIGLAYSLLENANAWTPNFPVDAEIEVSEEIMNNFKELKIPIQEPPGWNKLFQSKQGLFLATLFMKLTYEKMVEIAPNEDEKNLVLDYEQSIKKTLMEIFYKAYSRSVISGAVQGAAAPYSTLRGLDQFYGQEKEIEKSFPESMSVRKAMKALGMEGLKPFDVHSGNVMMRPKTKEIVIVDLGRFKT
jgi:hypothetical protein